MECNIRFSTFTGNLVKKLVLLVENASLEPWNKAEFGVFLLRLWVVLEHSVDECTNAVGC